MDVFKAVFCSIATQSPALTIIIILYAVVTSSSNIPGEINTGTLGLLVTKHYKRKEIFSGKLLTIILLAFILFIYIFIVSFIIGILFWGIKGFDIPHIIMTTDRLKKIDIIEILSFKYLAYFITLLNLTVLTFCISCICNSSSISCVISMIVLFCGAPLSSIFKNYIWYKYLYFSNLDISIYLGNYNQPINDLYLKTTMIKHIIYIFVFIFISTYLFQCKEIKCKN